jgi:cephalosporin hydroxylase
VFPIHYIKRFLKNILPRTVVAYIIRYRGEKLRRIDLSVLSVIDGSDSKELSDSLFLESHILPVLGFNNENMHEFPQELFPFCGKGLLHWQYPNQFGKYLSLLSELKPESYLEIGVRHGGTFIITLEYLKKFTVVKNAIAVDIAYPPSIVLYKKINSLVSFYQINSQLDSFTKLLAKQKNIDLVFIDGNHEEQACMNDFNNVKEIANMIVLHDIASDACAGVKNSWSFIKKNYSSQYLFFEFTDQYESVKAKTGLSFFGIGLAVKKEFARLRGIK